MIFSSSLPGTSSREMGRLEVTRWGGLSGLVMRRIWACLNFRGQCPEASAMLKINCILCRIELGVWCRIVLFILLGPGALFFVVEMAQDTSSSDIGRVSGLFASSVVRSMVSVGVVRCKFCCMCVLTSCSVCWSNCALSCGVI